MINYIDTEMRTLDQYIQTIQNDRKELRGNKKYGSKFNYITFPHSERIGQTTNYIRRIIENDNKLQGGNHVNFYFS